MKANLLPLCVMALFTIWFASAQANDIVVEGAAAMDEGGQEKARQLAILDAVHQAEISYAARVESGSVVSIKGISRESLRVTPTARVSNYTVLREWSDDSLLHVQIRAQIGESEAMCDGQQVSVKYKKKIAVTRFNTSNSLQVEDIADIWNGYPLEILRRLDEDSVAVPTNRSPSLLTSLRDPNPDSPANQEIIRQIAAQAGAQFVISGIILDAGVGKESIRPYWGWQGNESGRRFELGLPWSSVAAGVKPSASERRFEVEIFLHDGLTGAAIARHRDAALSSGNVVMGRDKHFASMAFFATDFGQTVKHTLEKEVAVIKRELACLPFMATIIRLNGRKAFVDAGRTSLLSPGDKLMVYHRTPDSAVNTLGAQLPLGIPESPATTITITQVQPLFSIGELAVDPAKVNIQVGDLVRTESEESSDD